MTSLAMGGRLRNKIIRINVPINLFLKEVK